MNRREPEHRLSPDLAAMRQHYEARILTINELCECYAISRSRFYQIVTAEGWRLRSPKRVDKNDLTQRLLALLEQQVEMLEETMKKTPNDQTVVLGKLSMTLDRLIAVDRETGPAAASPSGSKMMQDIRTKVAERIRQMNGD